MGNLYVFSPLICQIIALKACSYKVYKLPKTEYIYTLGLAKQEILNTLEHIQGNLLLA